MCQYLLIDAGRAHIRRNDVKQYFDKLWPTFTTRTFNKEFNAVDDVNK